MKSLITPQKLAFLAAAPIVATAIANAAQKPFPPATSAIASAPERSISYGTRIVMAIKPNIVWKDNNIPEARCEVEVDLDAKGYILARRAVWSQGHADWCPTVLRALDRTERIPTDSDGRVPPRLSITFRSKE